MTGLIACLIGLQVGFTATDLVVPDPSGGTLLARLFVPQPPPTAPAPFIGILPGGGAGISSVEWAASALATNGYLAMVVLPSRAGSVTSYANALEGVLNFAGTAQNPHRSITDLNRIGGAGWSLGARALTLVQHRDARLKAIVAWDNLATVETGDQGSPSANFDPPKSTWRTPKAPALGMASDATSFSQDPEVKKTAYTWWVENRQPAMQIVFGNSNHFWWSGMSNPRQRGLSMHYTLAWFDLWLKDDPSGSTRLLSRTVQGEQTGDFLSAKFRSAISIESRRIEDLRRQL